MADAEKPALIALRDRRDEVIRVLSDGYANDLLGEAAFEERVMRAHEATRIATLDALVADLTLDHDPAPLELAPIVPVEHALVPLGAPKPTVVRAIFSSIERHGAWEVPRELTVAAVFGSAVLDLREARLELGTTELRVRAVFGSLEIVVPPHLAVQCDGSAIFASFEHRGGSAVADPDRPLLRIVGTAIFGNIEVKVRPPGGFLARVKHALGLDQPRPRPALPPHTDRK